MTRLVSNVSRLAIVEKVDYSSGIVYTKWADQSGEDGPTVPIPHPFSGQKGEGIYVGLKKGSILVLTMLSNERYVPTYVLPMPGAYGNLIDVDDTNFDDIGVPWIEGGDIIIQGASGAKLSYKNNGDVILNNPFSEGITYSGELDEAIRCSILNSAPVSYNISQSGIKADGLVRRDVRSKEGSNEFADYLTDLSAERVLEEIGWDASKRVSRITRYPFVRSGAGNKNFKNPAFVENRELIYEFGREWYVKNFLTEIEKLENSETSYERSSNRSLRRNNILGLSQLNPNELIERVSGTLVDIFGNLLTINKSILPTPNSENYNKFLRDVFEINRHSVALHMEINTKKGYGYREIISNTRKPSLLNEIEVDKSINNSTDRSKWSLRVDKEGLTTINIPSTSETGNIPLLSRFENSSVLEVDERGNPGKSVRKDPYGVYRNGKGQDIYHDQFGPGGIKVSGYNVVENRLIGNKSSWVEDGDDISQKTLPKYIESGTAFHDITKTALSLLTKTGNIIASDIFDEVLLKNGPGLPAISNEINAVLPKDGYSVESRDELTGLVRNQPNAGGRSAQINLDGNLEMSIGANTIDRVSWILDTAGALVARLGRDRQGRSAVIHADGTVALELGGFDFIGESANDEVDLRFVGGGDDREKSLPGDKKQFKSGKLVIKLRRANPDQTGPDEEDSFIIIDETGVSLVTAGRLNLISGLDMTLKSDSRILLEAPIVQNYIDNPKFIIRDGRRI